MKYILITESFQKQLKKFKKHFSERDIVLDIKSVAEQGLRKKETYLKQQLIGDIPLQIAKLRFKHYQVHARYLLGIVENQKEYIPIIIDLKTGPHGENLSFDSKKKTQKAIESALHNVIEDYIHHTPKKPRMKVFKF